MGYTLAELLADVRMNWIVDQTKKINPPPIQFYRYVDDYFALFSNQDDILNFYQQLHKIHIDIQFTYEIIEDYQMAFLDVQIDDNDDKLKLNTYQKPTNSG